MACWRSFYPWAGWRRRGVTSISATTKICTKPRKTTLGEQTPTQADTEIDTLESIEEAPNPDASHAQRQRNAMPAACLAANAEIHQFPWKHGCVALLMTSLKNQCNLQSEPVRAHTDAPVQVPDDLDLEQLAKVFVFQIPSERYVPPSCVHAFASLCTGLLSHDGCKQPSNTTLFVALPKLILFGFCPADCRRSRPHHRHRLVEERISRARAGEWHALVSEALQRVSDLLIVPTECIATSQLAQKLQHAFGKGRGAKTWEQVCSYGLASCNMQTWLNTKHSRNAFHMQLFTLLLRSAYNAYPRCTAEAPPQPAQPILDREAVTPPAVLPSLSTTLPLPLPAPAFVPNERREQDFDKRTGCHAG